LLRYLVVFFSSALLVGAAGCTDDDEPPPPDDPNADAGPPNGFDACQARFFGNYLRSCSTKADCGGELECDSTKKFATTPRCHVRLCEEDVECEEAFGLLCTGEDFHYECRRASPLVPEECRIVEGPRPP
jgi:hypothetical protein